MSADGGGGAREWRDREPRVPSREAVRPRPYLGLALRVHVHQGTPVPRPVHPLPAGVAAHAAAPRPAVQLLLAPRARSRPLYRRVGGGHRAMTRPQGAVRQRVRAKARWAWPRCPRARPPAPAQIDIRKVGLGSYLGRFTEVLSSIRGCTSNILHQPCCLLSTPRSVLV